MKIFGMEFAPLDIPRERRLQTLGVLHYTTSFLFLGFGMLFTFICLIFTSYYYIPLLYGIWYFIDRKTSAQGGRRFQAIRRWSLLKYAAEYFPVKLIKTHELHPSKNYILAVHPHGVMCHGHFLNFSANATGFDELFPGIRSYLCALAGQFMFPIFREYLMAAGAVSVSRESIEWILTKEGSGNAVAIMVGGATEALEAQPDNYHLKLQSRKGFCRLALKHGTSIVPIYSFGENDIYHQVPNREGSKVRKLQDFLTQTLGFSPPLFHGRGVFNYTFGIMPYRKPIHTVVGAPLDVEAVPEPTKEDIAELHTRYCKAIVDLFEEHKLEYGLKPEDHLILD